MAWKIWTQTVALSRVSCQLRKSSMTSKLQEMRPLNKRMRTGVHHTTRTSWGLFFLRIGSRKMEIFQSLSCKSHPKQRRPIRHKIESRALLKSQFRKRSVHQSSFLMSRTRRKIFRSLKRMKRLTRMYASRKKMTKTSSLTLDRKRLYLKQISKRFPL